MFQKRRETEERVKRVWMCEGEREKIYRCKNNEIFPYMEYDCFFIKVLDYQMNAQFPYKQILVANNCKE